MTTTTEETTVDANQAPQEAETEVEAQTQSIQPIEGTPSYIVTCVICGKSLHEDGTQVINGHHICNPCIEDETASLSPEDLDMPTDETEQEAPIISVENALDDDESINNQAHLLVRVKDTNGVQTGHLTQADRSLTIIHYYEQDAAIHWLAFPGKPDEATRKILKAAGWSFRGAVMQWCHGGLLTPLPELPDYEYADGGYVDYAEERAERYEDLADKAQVRRETAHDKAHKIGSVIPFGQPILMGHHSQRRHENDLKKIDNNMRKAIKEAEKVENYQDKAAASLVQRRRKHTPGAIARRLEELRKDYTIYKDSTDKEGLRCKGILEREIARLETELRELGGLPVDQIALQKGDLIVVSGHIVEVIKDNKRKSISGYLASPVHNLFSKESGYTKRTNRAKGLHDRTEFQLRIYTAPEWAAIKEGRTQAEAYAIAEAHLKERRGK